MPQPGNVVTQGVQRALLDPEFLDVTPAAVRLNNLSKVSDAVAFDPNGIGIASVSAFRGARLLDLVAACGIPIQQDRFAIKRPSHSC